MLKACGAKRKLYIALYTAHVDKIGWSDVTFSVQN